LNAAGKSTTFKILTGDIDSTDGTAFLNGYDINEDRFNAQRSIGFCPQYDYLPEYLTVEQTLKLFARLRGLDHVLIPYIVEDVITVFKLDEFKTKMVQDLRYKI
jgi:ATP-binding cassette subfamily A (ABC1) protein 3